MKSVAVMSMFLLLVVGSETVLACGDSPVMSTRKDNGKRIGLFISVIQIESAPEWKPGDGGVPPLSVTDAHDIVRNWAKLHYSRYDNVRVREISLRPYTCAHVSERWYYLFDLNPVIDGNELWGAGNWAAVLMDGSVVGTREY